MCNVIMECDDDIYILLWFLVVIGLNIDIKLFKEYVFFIFEIEIVFLFEKIYCV